MSNTGPNIPAHRTWKRWESFCLECLNRALGSLRNSANLPEGENALNTKLLDCLRVAAREVRPAGNYPLLRAECPPMPYGESEETSRRLKATPDFVWGYVDASEPNPLLDAREFTIECKRLRHASQSWNYNESYVEDGIQRFLDVGKKYGIGVPSGVMVGYWQAMDADDILKAVNATAHKVHIPVLNLSSEGWKVAAVSDLRHKLAREFPVSPFELRHVWVDLRGRCAGHDPSCRQP